ncbi:MAG TPA: hypothetical protein VGC47_13900 [Acidimicrobiia bacterium]
MTTTTLVRTWWAEYRCIHASPAQKVEALVWDRGRGMTPAILPVAWAAFQGTLDAAGYGRPRSFWIDRRCPTGISGQPCQSNGMNCSLHNYGLAGDLDGTDPDGGGPADPENPHFHARFGNGWDFGDIKLTEAQVGAVEGIRTVNGKRVFRWLGWDIGDTMHFQIDCHPRDIMTGVASATGRGGIVFDQGEEDELRVARYNERGDHVSTYMELLHRRGFTPPFSRNEDGTWDGWYFDGMEAAVGAFIDATGGPGEYPGENARFIGPILRAALIRG